MSVKLLVLALCLILVCVVCAPFAWGQEVTERISLTNAGTQPNGGSWWLAMSSDGRFIAFQSWARDFVPGDTNWVYDIYLHDRAFGLNHPISLSGTGAFGLQESLYPAMSPDGKSVAFTSTAPNLVPGEANGLVQVYIRDWQTGVTERVSVSSAEEQANADCARASVSQDGRYVGFHSEATNLVPGAPGYLAVYVRDRLTQTTECASVSTAGQFATQIALDAAITPDGRYVAFLSYAGNLVLGDGNPGADAFLRDRQAGTTEIVSLTDLTGQPANGSSYGPSPAITPDARYIAFSSHASNLVPVDANDTWDVFLRDRQTGRTELISVSTGGEQGDAPSGYGSRMLAISANGRYISFASQASNLVPDDINGYWDVFVRDRVLETTTRVSVSNIGGIGNFDAGVAGIALSTDGLLRAFDSRASDLVADDDNDWYDVFLRRPVDVTGTPAMVINEDEIFTNLESVTLDVNPAGCSELRFRNDPGAWSGWVPSATSFAWVIPTGYGPKTVVGQGRYPDLTLSDEFSDLIILDTVGPTSCALVINDDRDLTTNPNVVLTLTADDAAQMRFRNESSPWSQWRSYALTREWTLSPDPGLKTVYGQVRDAAGNVSPECSDYIILDISGPTQVSIVINGGAQYTASRSVTLTLEATDAADMRFRNESGAWTAWEPFATTRPWTLSEYDGEKIVYFQARDSNLIESAQTWDDIILDATPPAELDIIIDGDAESTFSHRVKLALTAVGAAEMRLRNESDSWSAWEPFATYRDWVLSSPTGVKTVGFQTRDAAGNQSASVSDTILLRDFGDILADFWARLEIVACVDAGIVQGYWDGTYRPQYTVTRDQMAVFIARALAGGDAYVPTGPPTPTFPDVDTDHWAYKYIEYVAQNNIAEGYWNGYQPLRQVDRAQMAVFIARSIVQPTGEAGLVGYVPPTTPDFPDVDTDYWAYKHIEYCFEQDIVQGLPTGYYRPAWVVDRAGMAVYIQRAFQLPIL